MHRHSDLDRAIRRELLAVDLRRYEAEYGRFTAEELAAAQAELDGGPPAGKYALS